MEEVSPDTIAKEVPAPTAAQAESLKHIKQLHVELATLRRWIAPAHVHSQHMFGGM